MNIKQLYGAFLKVFSTICGIDAAKRFDAAFRFHRILNLKRPETLADKVSYIELHEQIPLATVCTDKYEVRNYITEKGLAHILVPLVGGPWETIEEVDFSSLPNSFALKATHGCKMNYIVSRKDTMDIDKCREEMRRWMRTTYGTYSMEPHYIGITKRMYAEEYLGDMSNLIDYKFHCMNGIPQFILAVSDRKSEGDKAMRVTLDLFDMEWNSMPALQKSGGEIPGKGNIAKPRHLSEMIEIAKILSKDFKFVRVDLYEKGDKVFFGELTFSPACCVFPYFTDDFNREMGDKLVL